MGFFSIPIQLSLRFVVLVLKQKEHEHQYVCNQFYNLPYLKRSKNVLVDPACVCTAGLGDRHTCMASQPGCHGPCVNSIPVKLRIGSCLTKLMQNMQTSRLTHKQK